MIFLHHFFAISKRCLPSNDVVVLLQVEQVIFLLIVFIFSMDLVFDYKCHVTVGEADVLLHIQPAVLITVKSMTVVVAELWSY